MIRYSETQTFRDEGQNPVLEPLCFNFCLYCNRQTTDKSQRVKDFKGRVKDFKFLYLVFLIVVFPCMLTIIQLLFQQNAHVFYH
jgi:hypothetical protein